MAVAVKNTPEAAAARPLNRLAVVSLAGVAFILGAVGIVFYGIPAVWHGTVGVALADLSFVNYALLGVVMLAAAGFLLRLGGHLVGTDAPHGWRAGVAIGLAGVVLIGLLTVGVGSILQNGFEVAPAIGLPVTVAVGAALLFLFVRAYFRPGFERGLVAVEEQGWFTAASYKKTQGQRVRRATLLGVLAIAGCGIWTLMEHKTLEIAAKHWEVTLPYADGARVLLLRDVRYTVPLLLTLGALWLAYRLVNFPAFADFLIATEAEINKVSWATRKRLVQDTIVVLTTVILVTFFIFFVDIFWGWSLRAVGVLQLPEAKDLVVKEQDW